MVGPLRRPALLLALGVITPAAGPAARAVAQQAPATGEARPAPPDYTLPGEDPVKPFVPATPRTVAEQRRVDALRLYTTARALEDRRQFREAADLLEKAQAVDPESLPILRRLARLNFALGRDDAGADFARRAIAVDPGDIETLGLLLGQVKADPGAAEAILKGVADNPKLDKKSAGALLVDFELGKLYAATARFEPAADLFARLLDALDAPPGARLTPAERQRILGDDEGRTYLEFGKVFLNAKKPALAIRAFRSGLVYDPEDPALILLLAKTLQEANQGNEALTFIEKFLQRKPKGRESYDLLVRILLLLKRDAEILPRLEAFAAADPRNVPLQYLLAERYRQAGRNDRAEAIYKAILAEQQDTEKFPALFPVLVQERKAEDLVRLLTTVFGRLKRLEAIRPNLETLIADKELTEKVLDAGLAMMAAEPPTLDRQEAWPLLVNIATLANRTDKLVALYGWIFQKTRNPVLYRELTTSLFEAGKYPEAETALKDFLAKFPEDRNGQNLIFLGQIQVLAGKPDDAATSVREALRREPNDPETQRNAAILLNLAGQFDEAIGILRDALKNEPGSVDLNQSLGRVLAQVGRNDEAIAFYKGLLEKFPGNDEMSRIAHSGLSIVYTNVGDMAKSESELEVLLARDPEDAGVNNDLGYLYADQGKNLDKAESMIRKAVAEDPENSAYLDSLGWVLFKQGKYAEARVELEKAASTPRGEDATVQEHLGDAYFQLRDNPKARKAWERAETLAAQSKPPDKRLPEIRKKLASLGQVESSARPAAGENP